MTTLIGNREFLTIDRAQVLVGEQTIQIGKKMRIFPDCAIAIVGAGCDTEEDLDSYTMLIRHYISMYDVWKNNGEPERVLVKMREYAKNLDNFDGGDTIFILTTKGLMRVNSRDFGCRKRPDDDVALKFHNSTAVMTEGTGEDYAKAAWALGIKPKNIILTVSQFDVLTSKEHDIAYSKKMKPFDTLQIVKEEIFEGLEYGDPITSGDNGEDLDNTNDSSEDGDSVPDIAGLNSYTSWVSGA